MIQALLEETQSAITQAHQHPAKNRLQLPTSCSSSSHSKIPLTLAERIKMNSFKSNVELDGEEPSTPKRRQLLIHSDNIPHTSSTKMYHKSSINQGISNPSDMPATPLSSLVPQSSKSISSGRDSLVKGFRFFLMTKNPVVRSDELLEISSMRQDLYAHLAGVRSAIGVIPSALKACIVIKCVKYLANSCRTQSQQWAQIRSFMTWCSYPPGQSLICMQNWQKWRIYGRDQESANSYRMRNRDETSKYIAMSSNWPWKNNQ